MDDEYCVYVFVSQPDCFQRKLIFIRRRGARPEGAYSHLHRVFTIERVTCFIISLSEPCSYDSFEAATAAAAVAAVLSRVLTGTD